LLFYLCKYFVNLVYFCQPEQVAFFLCSVAVSLNYLILTNGRVLEFY